MQTFALKVNNINYELLTRIVSLRMILSVVQTLVGELHH
ncbi:hypothetical protein PALB_9400 [Pseudoalteromonas luteoviolacea B = ATCC 29581]|nr:hypothetical protein PALB_9400 [Pseudoalteromonas luteoviolacea B = ATCC 29581]